LLRIGDGSYSIYLIGPVVIPLVLRILSLFSHNVHLSVPVSGYIYLVGSVGGGILLWKHVELPLTDKAKKFVGRRVVMPWVQEPARDAYPQNPPVLGSERTVSGGLFRESGPG